ncbi:hypothetical protein [Nonomuraea cypriaca]|nr:hypothetical protein [Nonomuraea cypriaca]
MNEYPTTEEFCKLSSDEQHRLIYQLFEDIKDTMDRILDKH